MRRSLVTFFLSVSLAMGCLTLGEELMPGSYAFDQAGTASPSQNPTATTPIVSMSSSSSASTSGTSSTPSLVSPSPLSIPTPSSTPSVQPPTAPDYTAAGYDLTWKWEELAPGIGGFDIFGTRNVPPSVDPSTGNTTSYGGNLSVRENWEYDWAHTSWEMKSRSGKRTETEDETGSGFKRQDKKTFAVDTNGERLTLFNHLLESEKVHSIPGGTETIELHHKWVERYDENGAVIRKDGYERKETTQDTTSGDTRTVSYQNEKVVWEGPKEWTKKFQTDQQGTLVNGILTSEKIKSLSQTRRFYTNGALLSEEMNQTMVETKYVSTGEVRSRTENQFSHSMEFDPSGGGTTDILEEREFQRIYYADGKLESDKVHFKHNDAVSGASKAFDRVTLYRPEGSPEYFEAKFTSNGIVDSSLELKWDSHGELVTIVLDGFSFTLPLDEQDWGLVTRTYQRYQQSEAMLMKRKPSREAYPPLRRDRQSSVPFLSSTP